MPESPQTMPEAFQVAVADIIQGRCSDCVDDTATPLAVLISQVVAYRARVAALEGIVAGKEEVIAILKGLNPNPPLQRYERSGLIPTVNGPAE